MDDSAGLLIIRPTVGESGKDDNNMINKSISILINNGNTECNIKNYLVNRSETKNDKNFFAAGRIRTCAGGPH